VNKAAKCLLSAPKILTRENLATEILTRPIFFVKIKKLFDKFGLVKIFPVRIFGTHIFGTHRMPYF